MINGFFSAEETTLKEERMPSAPSCGHCKLKKHSKRNRSETKPMGKGRKGIVVVLDAYSMYDQTVFATLVKLFNKKGISLVRDCYLIPVTKCACGPDDSAKGAHNCRPFVYKHIGRCKNITAILCVGINPLISVLGHKWKKGFDTIDRWRGYNIPLKEYNVFVSPLFPPSYLIGNRNSTVSGVVFLQDIEQAINLIGKPFFNGLDFKEEKSCVTLLTELQGVSFLKQLKKRAKGKKFTIAFDYETNALKPYQKRHKLYCVGIAVGMNEAVVFPLFEQETKDALASMLSNKRIGKIAANMKFEEMWSRIKLKVKVRNWRLDTVLGAHIENQAEGVTGVKFQSAVKLGVFDYSDGITPFLKAKDKGGNAINRIHKVNQKDLLLYCGMDAIVEYRIGRLMKAQMGVTI